MAKSAAPKKKRFKTAKAATNYVDKMRGKGHNVAVTSEWPSAKPYIVTVYSNKMSNPSILSKLKKGIRGHIKLSRGRLIIKT